MKLEPLEELLKGDYGGLYAEVVTHDVYGIRKLPFVPTIIFDIGANIGIFTRFAHQLFPKARIFAVEPDQVNCDYFRKYTFGPMANFLSQDACNPIDLMMEGNILLCQMALGNGLVYHVKGARNGSGEVYLTAGLGYPQEQMKEAGDPIEVSPITSVSLDLLFKRFVRPSDRVLLKIDCEGGENSIWHHAPSMEAFCRADYVAMELHDYALHAGLLQEVKQASSEALRILSQTHSVTRNHVHVQALRKSYAYSAPV